MISFEWLESGRVNDDGLAYKMWHCVHQSGRVIAAIDGPEPKQTCYLVSIEGGQVRLYITLESAKAWSESECRRILNEEANQKALRRRHRRVPA